MLPGQLAGLSQGGEEGVSSPVSRAISCRKMPASPTSANFDERRSKGRVRALWKMPRGFAYQSSEQSSVRNVARERIRGKHWRIIRLSSD